MSNKQSAVRTVDLPLAIVETAGNVLNLVLLISGCECSEQYARCDWMKKEGVLHLHKRTPCQAGIIPLALRIVINRL